MNSRCALRANFARVLKHWRLQHRIPQKQMAAQLGFHLSAVSAWERGTRFPNGYALEHIVTYTGLSPCRLFCHRTVRCAPGQCALLNGRA